MFGQEQFDHQRTEVELEKVDHKKTAVEMGNMETQKVRNFHTFVD